MLIVNLCISTTVGFKIQVEHKTFVGAHGRAIEEDVSRKLEEYLSTLQSSAVECEEKGVIYITSKILLSFLEKKTNYIAFTRNPLNRWKSK